MALTVFGFLYLTVLIFLANAANGPGRWHRYSRVLQAAMPAVIAVQLLNRVSTSGAKDLFQWSYLGFAAAAIAIMLLLIGFESPWRQVERLIGVSGVIVSPRFDSRRPVHRLALLLMIFALAVLYWTSSAESLQQDLLEGFSSAESALLNLSAHVAAYVLLALLGVGWLVRRGWTNTFERLGLRFPTGADLLVGTALGCIVYLGVSLLMLVWQSAVPASSFDGQTAAARQIFNTFSGSLFLGALLALLAAIGEETLFRGALQPVFGVVIVSLFFTAIHLQYAATPAAAIVFAVSLAFGWARARLSTTAAIISHFVYNMIPFLLASPA
ncbi:MAG: CPBP family intramembrane metalloprotease [Chloroflexi bacterium]|nr:CPBP family intramembrane metalloprotease [Chloroflexota bacterium]